MFNHVSGSVVYRGWSAHKDSADYSIFIPSCVQGQEDRSSLTIQECQVDGFCFLFFSKLACHIVSKIFFLERNYHIPAACGPSLETSLRLQLIPDIKRIICRGCSSVKLVFHYDFAETSKIKSHKLIFWHSLALNTFMCTVV